jgi:hypothetical protein
MGGGGGRVGGTVGGGEMGGGGRVGSRRRKSGRGPSRGGWRGEGAMHLSGPSRAIKLLYALAPQTPTVSVWALHLLGLSLANICWYTHVRYFMHLLTHPPQYERLLIAFLCNVL